MNQRPLGEKKFMSMFKIKRLKMPDYDGDGHLEGLQQIVKRQKTHTPEHTVKFENYFLFRTSCSSLRVEDILHQKLTNHEVIQKNK